MCAENYLSRCLSVTEETLTEIEIERKFLVAEFPANVRVVESVDVNQGYIVSDNEIEVRIRRQGSSLMTLDIKVYGATRWTRRSTSTRLTKHQFDVMWSLTDGRRIKKTRTTVQVPTGHLIDVDRFYGPHRGLVMAEVEFADAASASRFVPLPWFGREVSEDDSYRNGVLAYSTANQSGG